MGTDIVGLLQGLLLSSGEIVTALITVFSFSSSLPPSLPLRLSQLSSLNLLEPVLCVSVVLDHLSKKCTHLLVGLSSGKLIIVSVKDIHSAG